MKICALTSGSIGNAVVIEDESDAILIDCGVTYKKFTELMSEATLDTDKIKNILVTHEHSDHIKGLSVTSRRLHTQIWSSAGTKEALYNKGLLDEKCPAIRIVEKYKKITVAGFEITPFPLSHDAAEPVGYIVERADKKIVWLTDTGYVSKEVMTAVSGADLYLIEMNHNIEMLQMTHRPWHLKQRILSDYGHLSNEDGAYILSKIMTDRTKHVFLSHLSQEANLPELALMTMQNILKQENINLSKLQLHLTYPLRPSMVIEI